MALLRPLATLAALAVPTLALAAPPVVGVATVVVNTVDVQGAGTTHTEAASMRQRIALADEVMTGAASRLQLTLIDRSAFAVGANARLKIKSVAIGGRGSATSATVRSGAFRFLAGPAAQRGSAIATPATTIVVRAAMLDAVVGADALAVLRSQRDFDEVADADPASATLVVLRGAGAIEVSTEDKTVLLDRPLLAAFVPRAGAEPIGPFELSLPAVAQLAELIIPPRTPTRPASSQPLPAPQQRQRQREYGYLGGDYQGDGSGSGPTGGPGGMPGGGMPGGGMPGGGMPGGGMPGGGMPGGGMPGGGMPGGGMPGGGMGGGGFPGGMR